MSKIVNSNINNVMYRGGECDALYHGANLIWRRGIIEGDDGNILNVTSASSTYIFRNPLKNNEFVTYNSNQDYVIDLDTWSPMGELFDTSTINPDKANNILKINKFPSTKNLRYAYSLFNSCANLTEIPNLSISEKCTSISNIFSKCSSLTNIDVSNWDIQNVKDFNGVFYSCSSLKNVIGLEKLNGKNLTSFNYTFWACSNLECPINIDGFTGNAPTDARGMFYMCEKVPSISWKNLNAGDIESFSSTFWDCQLIKSLDLSNWVVYSCNDFSGMFGWCISLEEIKFSDTLWDMSKATTTKSLENMFYDCHALTTVSGNIVNISASINLRHSPLTNESAMVFINGLAKISRQTITFSSTTYATLTDEQKKIAVDKGWTVASA